MPCRYVVAGGSWNWPTPNSLYPSPSAALLSSAARLQAERGNAPRGSVEQDRNSSKERSEKTGTGSAQAQFKGGRVNDNPVSILRDLARRLVPINGAHAAANGTPRDTAPRLVPGNGAAAANQGASRLERGAPAPVVVPGPVRQVQTRRVAFHGPHAGDEMRFLLEERTTKFDDGTWSRDYIWVRGQYVLVVPISDSGVVFIRQYKKAAGRTLLVLPWGEIERGESPLDAGRRELEEETGYSFGTAEVHGPFHDLPDKSTGGHWVVVARNAYRKGHAAADESERIHGIEFIPMGKLWQEPIPVLMHVGALRLAGL
jgi:8-oxo-dGTP pyrophosphatase MutT (NUDIX family)